MRWKPVSEGPKFEDFRQLWSLMRADDVLSESARAALGIDQFRVPLEEATVPPVTDAGFLDPELGLSLYEPFLFDALYTFVIAINVLLNGGTPVEDIKGELLLNQLRRTEFEGISGSVAFDENGDRQASYELVNLHPDGSFRVAGLFSSSLGQFSVANGNVYWVGGVKADYPPFFLTDCGPGSYKDVDLGQCIPCAKGFQCVNGTQELCPKGTFSNETGLVACQLCVKGSFSSDLGSTKCRSCPAGFFADQEGMESCKRCPKGSYMPFRHADSCLDCGMDQVTEESGSQLFSDCRCAEGTYMCNTSSSRQTPGCRPCPEGLKCVAGLELPVHQAGYWTSFEASDTCSFSVLKCRNSRECPGNVALGQCASGREGRACNNCKPNHFPRDDGTCQECGPTDFFPAIAFGCIVVAVFVLWPGCTLLCCLQQHTESVAEKKLQTPKVRRLFGFLPIKVFLPKPVPLPVCRNSGFCVSCRVTLTNWAWIL